VTHVDTVDHGTVQVPNSPGADTGALSGYGQPFDATARTAFGHVGGLSRVHCTRVCQGSTYSAAVR
jgi:hypothetical protein